MIHIHHEGQSEPVAIGLLRTSVGAWLDALRQLDITAAGTRSAGDGTIRAGLRLTAGTHPLPGATYRFTESSELDVDGEKVPHIEQSDVEVLADDASMVQIQVRKLDSTERVTVTFEPPTEPTTCTIDLQGPVEASIEIRLDQIPVSADPQITVELLHRFAAAEGSVAVRSEPGPPTDRWRWTVQVEARGRSVVRPIASLAWLFARRRVKAELTSGLDGALRDSIAALNTLLAEQGAGGATPETGARRTVDAWVEQLDVELPPG